jgi:hypothetical protein
MGDAERTKDRRANMHEAGARWIGLSDGDTQQPPLPPASLLYTVAKLGGATVLWGGGVTQEQEEPVTASFWLHLPHFCGWGCAKLSLQFI